MAQKHNPGAQAFRVFLFNSVFLFCLRFACLCVLRFFFLCVFVLNLFLLTFHSLYLYFLSPLFFKILAAPEAQT